jgi:hypothetical protein
MFLRILWFSSRDIDNGFLGRPAVFEAVYFFLNDFFEACEIPFRIFIWFLAFVSVFVKVNVIVYFSKSSLAAGVSVLIYAFVFFLLHEFTQIRVGLAIACIFLAVRALVGGSRVHFLLFVALAAGFHSSALMALLLLLPYGSHRARWVDFCIYLLTAAVTVFTLSGAAVWDELLIALSSFDPRIALYVEYSIRGHSQASNPFPLTAILLLVLVVSLIGVEFIRDEKSTLEDRDVYIIVLARRSILIGFTCLVALSPVPELALRLFEIEIALIPILSAVIFSRKEWFFDKFLLLLWTGALAFIYISRDEGLVRPYVFFFL